MATIPAEFQDLFQTDAFAHFATVLPDGTPHVTPVWVDYDGEHVLVNTARGRQKERNVRHNPKVGLSVTDPENPYRFVQIRGEVETVTEEGAVEHINELAKRYMGVEEYPNLGEEQGERVKIEIRPDRVITGG